MTTDTKVRFTERLDLISYRAIFALWMACVSAFAFIFYTLCRFPQHGLITTIGGHTVSDFFTALYFSIITATSTGYGDIVPIGASRIFASCESVLAFFLFAIFVSKLLSRRQDIALTEVHRLSFRTAFHNIREDLYVVRKDFDVGIHAVRDRGSVSENEWKFLVLATHQVTHILQELPDFYDRRNRLHALDDRQEKLLLDSVERTLNRIADFCEALRRRGVVCDESAHHAFSFMLRTAKTTMPLWEAQAAAINVEPVKQLVERLRGLIDTPSEGFPGIALQHGAAARHSEPART